METFKPKKNVIHVSSDEDSRIYKWEKDSTKLSKNLEIVSIDDIESMPLETRRQLFSMQEIEEGMVFIKDPYSDRFYLASEAANELSKNKYNALSTIAMYLGAKKIVREVESVKVKTRDFQAGVGSKYNVVAVDLNVKNSTIESYKTKYNHVEEFDGIATENGYLKAVEYCKRTGLIYDQSITYLLESRNPSNDNKKRIEDIHTDITNEVDNSLDIAFSINALGNIFTLNAKCENSMKFTNQVIIHSRIEF